MVAKVALPASVGRLVCAGLLGIALAGPARADVNVLTWGGAWLSSFEELAKMYEAETGVPVHVESMQGGSAGGLARLKAQKNNPTVDVWTVNLINYERALGDDLLAPLDADKIASLADVPDSLKYDYGVAAWVSMRGIAYRHDLAPFEIKTWDDLWDPRLKGKLGAPEASFDSGLFQVITALTAGGSETDIDPGFEKLAELRDNIATFYKSNTQAVQLIESGEVAALALVPLPNFYQKLGPDSELRYVVPSDPTVVAPTPITLIKDAPNAEEATAFIDFVLSPPAQEILAAAFGSAPANKTVALPEGIAQYAPDMDTIYDVDFNVVSENIRDWTDRYNREVQTR